jgi:hypothetical protein
LPLIFHALSVLLHHFDPAMESRSVVAAASGTKGILKRLAVVAAAIVAAEFHAPGMHGKDVCSLSDFFRHPLSAKRKERAKTFRSIFSTVFTRASALPNLISMPSVSLFVKIPFLEIVLI